MHQEITPEQLGKLPKWAQEYIKDLDRERFCAIRSLNEYLDSTTESPFSVDDYVCTGEKNQTKTRYIQTHKLDVRWKGVEVRIRLRDDHIDLSWSPIDRRNADCSLIPYSFQQVRLVSKENMR